MQFTPFLSNQTLCAEPAQLECIENICFQIQIQNIKLLESFNTCNGTSPLEIISRIENYENFMNYVIEKIEDEHTREIIRIYIQSCY